jgi:hypothetical protein
LTREPDPLPTRWQRLLALSGVAFGVLFVFGWFLSGGDVPDYAAPHEDWTAWAADNRARSGIGAYLTLLAGFAFLHFAGAMRIVLGSAQTTTGGSLAVVGSTAGRGFRGPPWRAPSGHWTIRQRTRVAEPLRDRLRR